MRSVMLLLVLAFLSTASAAGIQVPDVTGDVAVDSPAPGPAYTGPGNGAVDLVQASIEVVGTDAVFTFKLLDLGSVTTTDVGVTSDTMFVMEAVESGGGRNGDWTARADYQPGNSIPWKYWAEGPCLNPTSGGGCAGEDRDIHDGMAGSVDLANNTVKVRVPLKLLGAKAGTALSKAYVITDAVWPSYPIYIGDRAKDDSGATLILIPQSAAGPAAPSPAAPSGSTASDRDAARAPSGDAPAASQAPAAKRAGQLSALPVGGALVAIAFLLRRR